MSENMMDKIPIIDKDKVHTSSLTYTDLDEWINHNVEGKTYRERLLVLCTYYRKHKGVPPIAVGMGEFGEDAILTAKQIDERIINAVKGILGNEKEI